MKKTRMKRFQSRSLMYWGILAVEATNKNQEDCLEDGSHLQRLTWDVTVASHGHRSSIQISTGANPPPSLSIQHGGRRSLVDRSPAEIQAWLNLKNMTALYNYIKRGWNKLPTRRFVPVDFKKPCAKKRHYLSNLTLGASGHLTMKTRVQWLQWLQMLMNPHAGAVKKYSIKNTSSISRKPEKAAYEKMSVSVDWKPERAVQAKIRDMHKKDYPDR